jgi:hypothetical protein
LRPRALVRLDRLERRRELARVVLLDFLERDWLRDLLRRELLLRLEDFLDLRGAGLSSCGCSCGLISGVNSSGIKVASFPGLVRWNSLHKSYVFLQLAYSTPSRAGRVGRLLLPEGDNKSELQP